MTFGMVEDPINLVERSKVANKCLTELKLTMPALVDKLDDRVNKDYKGWPDRLYVIGTDGKIAYTGGRGPFFFSPDEWEASIRAQLGRPAAPAAGRGAKNEKKR